MNPIKNLAPMTFALLLAACGSAEPAAQATTESSQAPVEPAAEPTAEPAEAATQTEAVYGDEAPVAIDAEPAEAEHGHAHNADGSHAEGNDHGDDESADDHGHDHGDGEHEH